MRVLTIAISLLSICLVIQSEHDSCELSRSLFQKRATLTAALSTAIVKNDGTAQHQASKEIANIDRQYHRFMEAVSLSAGKTRNSKDCCTQQQEDPVAKLICALAMFRGGNSTAEQFIQAAPTTPVDRDALWILDQIAHAGSEKRLPGLFGPDGPISDYLTVLFGLVRKNERGALEKYLGLYLAADGEYSELMEDQLEKLFLQDLQVVIQKWSLVKQNPRVLEDLRESFSAEQRRQIISNSKKYCSSASVPCKELAAALH